MRWTDRARCHQARQQETVEMSEVDAARNDAVRPAAASVTGAGSSETAAGDVGALHHDMSLDAVAIIGAEYCRFVKCRRNVEASYRSLNHRMSPHPS
jgi:hypothetical protein